MDFERQNKLLPNVKCVYIKAFSRHFELVATDLSVSPWNVWLQVINKLIQNRVEAFSTPVFHSQISQTCSTKHWTTGLNTQQLKLEDALRSKECDWTSVSSVNELMGWAAVVHYQNKGLYSCSANHRIWATGHFIYNIIHDVSQSPGSHLNYNSTVETKGEVFEYLEEKQLHG